jgi:hypothetical protein
VLLCRGLCDEPITRPEESYRLWCVVVCDLENLVNEETMTRVGSQHHKKNESYKPTAFWGSSHEISLLAGKGVNQECESFCHGVCRQRP